MPEPSWAGIRNGRESPRDRKHAEHLWILSFLCCVARLPGARPVPLASGLFPSALCCWRWLPGARPVPFAASGPFRQRYVVGVGYQGPGLSPLHQDRFRQRSVAGVVVCPATRGPACSLCGIRTVSSAFCCWRWLPGARPVPLASGPFPSALCCWRCSVVVVFAAVL